MKKQFRITLNGKTYEVVAEVLDEESAATPAAAPRPARSATAVAPAAAPAAPAAPAASGSVPSPLAGKVVSINAPVGTQVKAGQKIVTLEAMKMNTVVNSPQDGTVKAVHVSEGDSVEEGQPLLTIE